MKQTITYFLLLLAFISLGKWSFAQNVSFTATSSHSQVATGDRFKIEFKINSGIDNFKAPDLNKNFRVLSGPNQSTSMSWVNGKTSTTLSYSFILMAVKEGTFTISPAIVTIDGEEYESNSIEITVTKGAAVQQNNTPNNSTTTKTSGDLFIKASVNKTTVYQGEHLVATYQLYTKIGIAANEMVKNADLNGFWSQEVNLGQAQWREEVINNQRWNVATIRKIVLFPQRSGDLEIDPLEMRFITQKRVSGGQSIFDQFFGKVVEEEVIAKSKPIKIKVLPHPEPKPESFDNAVGQLTMKAEATASEVKANEAINIKILISGNGNLPLINNPTVNFPQEFEIYDPKITDNSKTAANGVSGSKEFDYLIIPRFPGKYNLAPITFTYFNPASKKYETISSDPFQLTILKGDGDSKNLTYTSGKEDIQLLNEDIRYIHTIPPLFIENTTGWYGTWKFYTAIIFSLLLIIAAYILKRQLKIANSDLAKVKSRKAGKLATKLLSSAKKHLAANNKNEFYEAVSKALFGYVGDKLNIAVADLNQENIKNALVSKQLDENIVAALMETLDLCDMARFAPVPVSEQEVYNKAENIINQIEKALA
ncbi:MAG TPA: BatD family protein [Vicingaceae bacterium]|nr:BatD family protein [Vicingaceae bacterium]